MRLINNLQELSNKDLVNSEDHNESQLNRGAIKALSKLTVIFQNLYSDPRDATNEINSGTKTEVSGRGDDRGTSPSVRKWWR